MATTGTVAARDDSAARWPVGCPPHRDQRRVLSHPCRGGLTGSARGPTATGRPSATGIVAGHWTGPGRRSWIACGRVATRPRAVAGRSVPTRPSTGPISTPPAPVALRSAMPPQGAASNGNNSGGREALGRSRGGWTTKIHLLADRRCRPVARLISPGQDGDAPRFVPLLETIRIQRRSRGRPRTRPARVLADKAYSSRDNRDHLRRREIQAVIPVKEDQKPHRRERGGAGGRPPAFDAQRYKERNTVERCFNKLKQHRAVATRYDKRERIYQGTIDVASIRIGFHTPVP